MRRGPLDQPASRGDLGDEWVKERDAIAQHLNEQSIFGGLGLAEGYAQRRVAVHLHIFPVLNARGRSLLPKEGPPLNLCARYERARDDGIAENVIPKPHSHDALTDVVAGEKEFPVLVTIRELSNESESVLRSRPIRSLVRLVGLDECQSRFGDPQSALERGGFLILGQPLQVNGEGNTLRLGKTRRSVLAYESVNEMVKCGSHTKETLTHDDRKPGRGSVRFLKSDDVLGCIVELSDKTAGFTFPVEIDLRANGC